MFMQWSPIHCGFSSTTVTISAISLPPSCLVVTLTNQPGLRSDNASCLLDESCLPGLGRPRELDDLCLGFEDDGHVACLTLRRRLERQGLGRGVDRFDHARDHVILLCTASGAQRNPASAVGPPRDSDST